MSKSLSNETTRALGITEEELSEITVDVDKAIAENDIEKLSDFIQSTANAVSELLVEPNKGPTIWDAFSLQLKKRIRKM